MKITKLFILLALTAITTQTFAQSVGLKPIFEYSSSYDANTGFTKTNGDVYKQIYLNKNNKWMSPDVQQAWKSGYTGKGVTIHNYDYHIIDYKSKTLNSANNKKGPDGKTYNFVNTHGDLTMAISHAIAPDAKIIGYDVNSVPVGSNYGSRLSPTGLNVVNVSLLSSSPSQGLKYLSSNNRAVVVIGAANDNLNMGEKVHNGQYREMEGKYNLLSNSLKSNDAVIFAGALRSNGKVDDKTVKASYSNKAGDDPKFQDRFLMVGVDYPSMGFAGTSAAAPIISGYAAIVGSKFKNATPNQVTNQLLTTARTDTIANYNKSIHGRGEASLSRALAPTSIK